MFALPVKLNHRDAGIAARNQEHARAIINGVLGVDAIIKVFVIQDKHKHNHAEMAGLSREPALHHADGADGELAQGKVHVRRGRLSHAEVAEHQHAKIIFNGVRAQGKVHVRRGRQGDAGIAVLKAARHHASGAARAQDKAHVRRDKFKIRDAATAALSHERALHHADGADGELARGKVVLRVKLSHAETAGHNHAKAIASGARAQATASLKHKDAGIAARNQGHAKQMEFTAHGVHVPGKEFVQLDNLIHNHAAIVGHKQEPAVHHANGLAMEHVQEQEHALRAKQILWDAQHAKQEHARIIAIGAHARAPAPALPVRPNV